MTTAIQLMSKLSRLSEDQQRIVLQYVENLVADAKKTPVNPFNPYGFCADLRSDLSLEEFQRNRQEMWGSTSDEEF